MRWESIDPPTPNFSYKYDADMPGAEACAYALYATCERDFARLEQPLFGVPGGFGPGNRVTVEVQNLSSPQGSYGGLNGGYSSDVPMTIEVNVDVGSGAFDRVRQSFVDEMAEILMDYRNRVTGTTSWIKNHSDGEGLSRVCGIELYPRLGIDDGLQSWFNSNPRDYTWIDASDDFDTHPLSWGISLLFIYYLRTQLEHPLSDVIQKAGTSLAATYHNLTGASATDARDAFKALLERYLPAGRGAMLRSNDPFPFHEPGRRRISLNISSEIKHGLDLAGFRGHAFISPGGFCPKSEYAYTIGNDTETATLGVDTHGFASPTIRWTVAGIRPPSPDPGGYPAVTIQATVDVGDEQANAPGTYTWTTKSVRLRFDTLWPEPKLSNLDHPGLERFELVAEAIDQFADENSGWANATSASTYLTLGTRSIRWKPPYEKDKQRCEEQARDIIRRFTKYHHILILLTLPDPPPMLPFATVIAQLLLELPLLARDPEFSDDAVASSEAIARILGVSAAALLEGRLELPAEVEL
jgi:hypothetical protein